MARFRTRADEPWVSQVQVEAAAPHRIATTSTQPWIPDYLAPGLPADFTGVPVPRADSAVLIRDLMGVGAELLTTLAYRELSAGRSAILDTTSEDPAARARCASLAGAAFVPVVCACTDEALHRERVERRVRGIPGWADAGEWADASVRRAAFPPWPGALFVDTVQPLDTCVAAVVDRVGR